MGFGKKDALPLWGPIYCSGHKNIPFGSRGLCRVYTLFVGSFTDLEVLFK